VPDGRLDGAATAVSQNQDEGHVQFGNCVFDAALHDSPRAADHVADDQRDREMLLQDLEIDRRVLGRDVARGRHRRLHDKEVSARLLGALRESLRALRDRRDDDRSPALLDLRDPLMDQLLFDGLAIDALDDLRRLGEAGGGDPIEHGLRMLVAREDAFEVQHGEGAQTSHLHGKRGTDDAVHRRREDR
jgi:hypothetical protein